MGILRVLCEVVKLGSAEQIHSQKEQLLKVALILGENQSLMGNTLIRKFRTKLVSRIIIRLLPAKTRRLRAKGDYHYRCALLVPDNTWRSSPR